MKTALIGLLALTGVALATPTLAQGVSFDAPDVHVGVGDRGYYRDGDWRWRHRHGYYAYGSADCRTVTVKHRRWDGTVVVERERRC